MSLRPVTRRMATRNCFLYFAYGSNLLTERIHINNPSAKKIQVGKLKDYRLDFNYFSQRWKGCAATIVEDPGNHLYGVLWEIANEDLAHLDTHEGCSNQLTNNSADKWPSETQECVHQGIYKAVEVDVETLTGEQVRARSYQIIRPLEQDRRPSSVYLDVIVRGAKENGLPEDYVKFLEGIEHNGYNGEVDVKLDLEKIETGE
ncbi:gamma-glutamylcyclotransferase-like isoform X1 [Macrobrachium rosenbergii]|uniref:gamma-glutamylcyclotransferase-like isoform X1 n=1 Tax=Macrobrachium rosenbergii TaxID=79674 RepID=UPI0034D39BB7